LARQGTKRIAPKEPVRSSRTRTGAKGSEHAARSKHPVEPANTLNLDEKLLIW